MSNIEKGNKIGFIGQGFVGKNLANNFEKRGFKVVRYSLEPEYIGNKDKIKDCDIVFVAVPTPTTPNGFDDSLLVKVLSLVGKGKTVVIKSTILPGTTKILQQKFKNIYILHSPEFLSEATARHDTDYPFSNIVGVSKENERYRKIAQNIIKILPKAKFSLVCNSSESEIIKYAHNCTGFVQIIFFNLLYDLAKKSDALWSVIQKAIEADPYIPNRYANPIHKSGRGAGGHCFIKDFSAFREIYKKNVSRDLIGLNILKLIEKKNIGLLLKSKKDLDLLLGVYGKNILKKN